MEEKDTTQVNFEKAYNTLYRMRKILNITEVARHIGVNRCVLQAALNGNNDRYGNPVKLPQKYNNAVIEFIEKVQAGNIE